jgi:hypothetical protein
MVSWIRFRDHVITDRILDSLITDRILTIYQWFDTYLKTYFFNVHKNIQVGVRIRPDQ